MVVPINRPGIWYPEGFPGRAFDLLQLVGFSDNLDGTVDVWFRGNHTRPVRFDRTVFEDAYNLVASGTDVLAAEGLNLNSTRSGALTFDRASPAYDPYNHQLLPSGEPRERFFRVGNQVFVAHLVEGPSTNGLLWSTDLLNAQWETTDVEIQALGTGPDDLTTAWQLQSGPTGPYVVYQDTAGVGATTYTASVYLKAQTLDQAKVYLQGDVLTAEAEIDLTDGSVVGSLNADHVFVDDAGDGWYRLAVTLTDTFTTVRTGIEVSAIGQILVWAPQLEESLIATSYIPTQGSTASRVADLLSTDLSNLTGGQIPGTGEWSVHAVAIPYLWDTDLSFPQWQRWMYGETTLSANFMGLSRTNDPDDPTAFRYQTGTGDIAVSSQTPGAGYTNGQPLVVTAVAVDADSVELYVNGVSQGQGDAAGGSFEGLSQLFIGNRDDGLQPFWGWVGLLYYPRVLTPGEITALTTNLELA